MATVCTRAKYYIVIFFLKKSSVLWFYLYIYILYLFKKKLGKEPWYDMMAHGAALSTAYRWSSQDCAVLLALRSCANVFHSE